MDTTKHVVFDGIDQVMRCHHCGASKPLALLMTIDAAAKAMSQYVAEHKDCKAGGV